MLEKHYDENSEHEFKAYLESIGDSIVVVSDDDIVKVHVHTNDPGLAIQKALTYGSLSRMKIDNMREEHQETRDPGRRAQGSRAEGRGRKAREQQRMSRESHMDFIAVSVGDGLGEIFKGIGADYLIEGGQTMNPSTEDMVNAIEHVNADTVYILPNNKNIILAAEQAKYLVEDKQIIVVPSKTVPQGITALINFIPDQTPEENLATMVRGDGPCEDRSDHLCGPQYSRSMIWRSMRAISWGSAIAACWQLARISRRPRWSHFVSMVDDESELVTIYYGEDVTEEDAEAFCEKARKEFTSCEFECQNGGQPIYYYMISVE